MVTTLLHMSDITCDSKNLSLHIHSGTYKYKNNVSTNPSPRTHMLEEKTNFCTLCSNLHKCARHSLYPSYQGSVINILFAYTFSPSLIPLSQSKPDLPYVPFFYSNLLTSHFTLIIAYSFLSTSFRTLKKKKKS